MPVETFECQETSAEPIEIAEEAIGLIEELGLEGQLSLVRKADAEKPMSVATRWPYRVMTAEEVFVYGVLCPTRTEMKSYADGPIPIRVLQIAAHAKSVRPELQLFVWHRAVPGVKDPVLVAQTHDELNSWNTGFLRFILARWGEELEAFSTLMRKACSSQRERLASEAERLVLLVKGASDAEVIEKGPAASIGW